MRDRCINPNDPEDAARWAAALKRARIPRRYWSAHPEQVRGDNRWLFQMLDQPQRWFETGHGVYLHGPFNTGKTAAACVLGMELVRRAYTVLFLKTCDVPAVRFHENEDAEMVDIRLKRADLLILDDLGSERFRLTSAAGSALEEVFRIMYDKQRPIIVTSNIVWEQVPHYYSQVPALVSVMQRMCFPVVLNDAWPDAPEIVVR